MSQKPNEEVVKSVLRTFKNKNSLFEQLYVAQNKESRKQLVDMINKNFKTSLMWIEDQFRLEKPKSEMEVPLVLVKVEIEQLNKVINLQEYFLKYLK